MTHWLFATRNNGSFSRLVKSDAVRCGSLYPRTNAGSQNLADAKLIVRGCWTRGGPIARRAAGPDQFTLVMLATVGNPFRAAASCRAPGRIADTRELAFITFFLRVPLWQCDRRFTSLPRPLALWTRELRQSGTWVMGLQQFAFFLEFHQQLFRPVL